jgi:hypothetical protein
MGVDCRSSTKLTSLRFLLNNRHIRWSNPFNFELHIVHVGRWLSTVGFCWRDMHMWVYKRTSVIGQYPSKSSWAWIISRMICDYPTEVGLMRILRYMSGLSIVRFQIRAQTLNGTKQWRYICRDGDFLSSSDKQAKEPSHQFAIIAGTISKPRWAFDWSVTPADSCQL